LEYRMTSQLNVDTIVDKAGSGGTNVKIGNTSTYVGEGGSGTQNTVQGLAKSWVNFTGITTTASRDSFNISSLTDAATGSTKPISFTNNMGNTNYTGSWYTNANTGSSNGGFNNDYGGGFGDRLTTSFGVFSYSSAGIDSFYNDAIIFGDLA